MMDDYLDFLRELTSRLTQAGIPYMITGSMAFAFYATPRMTRDIDLVVELHTDDVDRMIALFQADCYLDPESIQQAIKDHGMFNIIHNQSIIKADFIVRKNEAYRRMEFARRRTVMIDNHPIAIVSPEDLILSKLVWAQPSRSELQLRDIRQLLRAVPNLEMAYLTDWARELHVASLLEEVMVDA
jgi:hypothetical protein